MASIGQCSQSNWVCLRSSITGLDSSFCLRGLSVWLLARCWLLLNSPSSLLAMLLCQLLTFGWKPSAGFLQYPLVWLFECHSSVNLSLLFQNPTLLSSSGAGQRFPRLLRAGAILCPRQSPGDTPPTQSHRWAGGLRDSSTGAEKSGATAGLPLSPTWSSHPSSHPFYFNFYLFSSFTFKQLQ